MDLSIPFGDLRLPGTLALAASLDPVAIRTDLYWQDVQRDGWGEWTAMVPRIREMGIKVILVPNGPRGWNCWETRDQRIEFAGFCKEAALRFGDQVLAWQIGNEPNNRGNGTGVQGMPVALYADLLKRCYSAMKRVTTDPIATAGICPIQDSVPGNGPAVAYVRGLYANGCAGSFDALAMHAYSTTKLAPSAGDWQTMLRCRAEMEAVGDTRTPVWLSEVGAPTSTPASEQFQADFARSVIANRPQWLRRIMWFSAVDNPPNTQGACWGAFRADGSPKPVVDILKAGGSAEP